MSQIGLGGVKICSKQVILGGQMDRQTSQQAAEQGPNEHQFTQYKAFQIY